MTSWGVFTEEVGTKIASRNQQRIGRLQQLAAVAEHEMKLLAPWRNDTGAARQRLHARVIVTPATWATRGAARPTRVHIVWMLAQGVWYGEFLERNYGGRWAIVGPTAFRYRQHVKMALRGPFGVSPNMELHSGPPNPLHRVDITLESHIE